MLPVNEIICGSCLEVLRTLPDSCVDMCVTSPPYWGLRDYGVEGQLGLEKTPEEFIAKMVELFREVRRVLADYGTLWLNLGDSYAANTKGSGGASDKQDSNAGSRFDVRQFSLQQCGLKPKDLCGIPWRVALALQEPYYTGNIKNIHDRIWLAAMIDGEGCMFIHKRKAGQSNGQGYVRKNDNYGPGLEVANTHESIVQRCLDITGMGSICRVERETRTKKRNIPLYRWNLRTTQCREVIREIYPHLVGKQHEARILLGCPSSGENAEKAHASLIALHNGKEACIDFPAPTSMFEQGWYLRQDVIWHKNNPMPESVRDRCTKAHEYIFLLSKKPKYYYDQEAIKEEAEPHRGLVLENRESGTGKARGMGNQADRQGNFEPVGAGRNKRSVWTIPTQAFSEAHFATFPEKLVEPCILAGCPKEVCTVCGKPRERILDVKSNYKQRERAHAPRSGPTKVDSTGWQPPSITDNGFTDCGHGSYRPGIVLDPFMGSGTVAVVAHENARDWLGIELNPEYIEIAEKRIGKQTAKYELFERTRQWTRYGK